ncbi:6406_t:CDS:2, partial [Acaulospora morrowiae]
DERSSISVNKFWMTVNEELINDKIKNEENEYDLILTTNVNKQMGTYVNATSSRLTKRFVDCANESPPKRVTRKVIGDDYPFIASEITDESNLNELGVSESNTTPIQEESSPAIDYYRLINKGSVQDGGFRTPPHQIVSNTYSPEISINENILRMSVMSLAKLDESKYFGEFIPHFIKYKKSQRNNPFSYTIDDVMDIRGEGGFSKFLSVDDYIKLLSKNQRGMSNCQKETTESGSTKNISDWIRITKKLNILSEDDSEEVIKIKEYLYRVMIPFMEVPVQASKYRKNYGYNHIIDRVVDGKSADLLARMWKTGEEIFVGEQAGPPTQHDLTKLETDSFKLYREMRDCLNVRILRAMGKGDINYNNQSVFGILGYLLEIKMHIMWKDGVYVYEEYGSLNIASNPDQISEMKSGILRLLEFMMIIKIETKNNVTDSVQILKRKYDEIIQTKPSPSKVAKR